MLTSKTTAANGVSTIIHLDGDGNLTTGTEQDCTPIIDGNKELRAAGLTGTSEMRHAGRAPFVVVEKFCNERGITFKEFCNEEHHKVAFLNSPDYAACRIWEGVV
jgi:hypothetical protein